MRITEQRYAESYDMRMWWGVQQGEAKELIDRATNVLCNEISMFSALPCIFLWEAQGYINPFAQGDYNQYGEGQKPLIGH